MKGSEDRATLIIAHRLTTVEKSHNIYVLSDGKIVEQGTHDELLKTGTHYRAIYYRQLKADTKKIND